MPTKSFAQDMQIALNQEIAALRNQQDQSAPVGNAADKEQVKGADESYVGSRGAPPPPAPQAAAATGAVAAPPAPKRIMPDQGQIVAHLGDRIQRLQLVSAWIGEDDALARLIDTVIGQQVKTSEQRQTRFSLLLSIIFLIVGWALSLLTMPALSTMLQHL